MRIITGKARGKHLLALEGRDVRPTTDRVKESLFNIIQFEVEGRRFLDLFAGSGQVGLEAVSRGAREAVLVDSAKESIDVIRKNVENTDLSEQVRVVQSSFDGYLLRNDGKFDIAFLDPPYGTGLLQQALPMTAERMQKGGTIICEHPVGENMPEAAGDFLRTRTYKYGKIMLTFYRHKDVTS